ncbi:hypothetical protein BJN42_10565 [Pseudomonas koreensis]|uniref:Uncharacterized protein n=1 Tax=Pseudomonas moraviensis R28-S TaxID=1395516 RepID=V8RDQ8_9PSED|nr:hypothetical protein PMO01_08515 [Pseudomonas moraviensis R28-S]OFJ45982.1 hypothetical protein BJN42_10565 [Pseudomonas koreensis]
MGDFGHSTYDAMHSFLVIVGQASELLKQLIFSRVQATGGSRQTSPGQDIKHIHAGLCYRYEISRIGVALPFFIAALSITRDAALLCKGILVEA